MGDRTIPIGDGIIKEYGNGVMKLQYKEDIYLGHPGGTLKYQSFMFCNPEKKTTISLLINSSGRYFNNLFFQDLIPVILDEL